MKCTFEELLVEIRSSEVLIEYEQHSFTNRMIYHFWMSYEKNLEKSAAKIRESIV